MKKIIVPVDFSNDSFKAVDLALHVAENMKAGIELIYVMEEKHDPYSTSTEEHRAEVEKEFKESVNKYKDKLAHGEITYEIAHGKVYKEVINHAKYQDAELIVTSTHGSSGFEELFIGSNAHRMITFSEVPVLVIRNDVPKQKFKRILLPVNDSRESRQKVPFVADFAKFFDATIVVQPIPSTKDERTEKLVESYLKQTTDYLDKAGTKYETKDLMKGDFADNVINAINDDGVDLIALIAIEEENVASYVFSGNIHEIVRKADVPVLTIHPRDIYRIADIKRKQY